MVGFVILAFALAGPMASAVPASPPTALVTHTYEARIRLNGKVSTKKLVQAQFPTATVLSVKKVD